MSHFDAARLGAFRERIEAELDELLALSASSAQDRAPVKLDQQSVGRLARMDAMQVQAMAVASGKRRTARINRLRTALEQIENGDYGYCASCDEPIPEGRLMIDPTAQLCISCASLDEK